MMLHALLGFLFFSSVNAHWADKTLKKMSREEKIAQLFMVAVHPDTKNSFNRTKNMIEKYHVGGVIFFEGEPEQQVTLVNQLQQASTLPLLVGQDCEWGLSQRLRNTISFPKNMTLGAIQDNDLIYEVGKEIGQECACVGVHINFAPVIDVNTNPLNPVIGMRSFGAHKERVAEKAQYFLQGLTDAGILGCIKHFPGHGDTITDSHENLPILLHTPERLLQEELYPFDYLIKNNAPAIMVGHLHIPALDSTPNMPATFSPYIVTDLLRKTFNFDGLIITDSLVMRAITKHWPAGKAEYMALRAGNDILLCPRDIPQAITLINQAIDAGEISEKELNAHVLKILHTKETLGLHKNRYIEERDILAKLNTQHAQELRTKLYQAALTLVRDPAHMIPLTNKNIATIQIGGIKQETNFYINPDGQDTQNTIKDLAPYETLIIGLCTKAISQQTQNILKSLRALNKKNIFVLFTSPYNLTQISQDETVIVAYENTPETWCATRDVIFGKAQAKGLLPVTI